jgi:hypothetical protein
MVDCHQRCEETAAAATLLERRTHADEPAPEIADVLDDDHLARISGLPRDAGGKRGRQVEALVSRVGESAAPLEELRVRYQRRPHRASDDFEATEGLRVLEAALSRIPRPEGVWAWQRREREPRRSWWRGGGVEGRRGRPPPAADTPCTVARAAGPWRCP